MDIVSGVKHSSQSVITYVVRHGAILGSNCPSVRTLVGQSVNPSVNICDHPSVDPNVQVHNSNPIL